jgi:uncharacterized LabA/DUF88 family protein
LQKLRIFVDFWNFTLSLRDVDKKYRIDWTKLPSFLEQNYENLTGEKARYDSAHVFSSIDERNPNEKNLFNFLQNTMSCFPGYIVDVKRRRPAGGVRCPICGNEIATCPHCGKNLKRTAEKGVDAAVITALITQAIDGLYDVAYLISDDSDYAPAAGYLNHKGYRIIHCGVGSMGRELRRACWNHLDLVPHLPKLEYA